MKKKLQKISCILQFTESKRFMASWLSNLANNLSEGIHGVKCKFGHCDKKSETLELNISIATVFVTIQVLKMI